MKIIPTVLNVLARVPADAAQPHDSTDEAGNPTAQEGYVPIGIALDHRSAALEIAEGLQLDAFQLYDFLTLFHSGTALDIDPVFQRLLTELGILTADGKRGPNFDAMLQRLHEVIVQLRGYAPKRSLIVTATTSELGFSPAILRS